MDSISDRTDVSHVYFNLLVLEASSSSIECLPLIQLCLNPARAITTMTTGLILV